MGKVENKVNVTYMSNNVGIGIQDFLELRENHKFYIDKTSFIKDWWESGDSVTLIGDWAFRGCSSLISIKYCGTEEEWNAISKGYLWDDRTGDYIITYNWDGE